ncbi:DCL family protein [Cupriavidus respiraculi]|nr:DCL family protein [Cupriavidus respiraculi]
MALWATQGQDQPGHTTCFFVVRTDGTSIDFSIRRAFDVGSEKAC